MLATVLQRQQAVNHAMQGPAMNTGSHGARDTHAGPIQNIQPPAFQRDQRDQHDRQATGSPMRPNVGNPGREADANGNRRMQPQPIRPDAGARNAVQGADSGRAMAPPSGNAGNGSNAGNSRNPGSPDGVIRRWGSTPPGSAASPMPNNATVNNGTTPSDRNPGAGAEARGQDTPMMSQPGRATTPMVRVPQAARQQQQEREREDRSRESHPSLPMQQPSQQQRGDAASPSRNERNDRSDHSERSGSAMRPNALIQKNERSQPSQQQQRERASGKDDPPRQGTRAQPQQQN